LEFIALDKPGAALRQVERLEDACWMLAKNPMMGTVREDLMSHLRLWHLGKYVICYRPVDDGIEIIRVVHGARDFDVLFK
jgi:toxin ParE1/3/4